MLYTININMIVFILIVVFMRAKMEIFTVSLFGHRKIDDLLKLERQLAPIVKKLIQTKPYVSFLIGRNGEFDEYSASVIKRVQKEVGKDNSDITLILPYKMRAIEYYEKYYDSIIIPDSVYGAHPKSAITLKNRWMIERSNLSLFYVKCERGGAYTAMRYAKKLNKEVVNLCKAERYEE